MENELDLELILRKIGFENINAVRSSILFGKSCDVQLFTLDGKKSYMMLMQKNKNTLLLVSPRLNRSWNISDYTFDELVGAIKEELEKVFEVPTKELTLFD